MTNKRIRLPREGVTSTPGEPKSDAFIGDDDVTGHGFPVTAPPTDFSKRGPSSGGEEIPTDDDQDVDGYRIG
jgi:hypothetical protein